MPGIGAAAVRGAPACTALPFDRVPRCIAIGASTGGVAATTALLSELDDRVDCPILITQHLPDAFGASYARQLHQVTTRPVHQARDGAPLLRGHIYLATGDFHLGCARTADGEVVRADVRSYPVLYTPSVDAMFVHVAACFGRDALGILLSGMGRDGLGGAERLCAVGAPVIVQDTESATVWGMPGAVANAGLASAVASPRAIADIINRAATSHP